MSFLEQQIPSTVRPGVGVSAEFMTTVKQLRGGGEHRNALWSNPLRGYSTSYGSRTVDDISDSLSTFIMETSGSLHGFRAKDWADFDVADEKVAVGDGSLVWFRLTKDYGTHSRRIFKPVPDTITVMVDGSAVAEDDFFIDAVNGTVVFLVAPVLNAIVSWSGEFDVPVRFDEDALGVIMDTHRHGHTTNVGLREVRVPENIDTSEYDVLRDYLALFDKTDLLAMFDVLNVHVNTNWEDTE